MTTEKNEDTENVTIHCVYFKPSGKFYSDGKGAFAKSDFPIGCIYPREFGEFLNSQRRLPGLNSGRWDGPFMVDVGYPELVIPAGGS